MNPTESPAGLLVAALFVLTVAGLAIWAFIAMEGMPLLATLVGLFALGATIHGLILLGLSIALIVSWVRER